MHFITIESWNFKCYTVFVSHILDTKVVVVVVYQIEAFTHILQADTRTGFAVLFVHRVLETSYDTSIFVIYIYENICSKTRIR